MSYQRSLGTWDSVCIMTQGGFRGLLMDDMEHGTACNGYILNELLLTRNILLAHLFAGNVAPEHVLRLARRYATVTHWEELICAMFNLSSSRLMAVVGIHQAEGYSGILGRHGSKEFVRFYIDWLDGNGMQAVGLSHFKVHDALGKGRQSQLPSYHLVSCGFDAGRYRNLVRRGVQPRLRAVLSWNHVPDSDVDYEPVFGNRVDSQISIDSDEELTSLFSITPVPSETTPYPSADRGPYGLALAAL